MTGQSGGETRHGAGIGSRLRSARERCDLTVEQAAHRLHVEPAVLQALEAEDFGSLGAPIYVKGYLGRYAELVGESAESLQQLLSSTVIPPPDLTRIPRAKVGGSRLVGPVAIAVVAALIVAGSLWWGVSRWREHHPVLLPVSRTVAQQLVARSTAPAAADKPSASAAALRSSAARRAAGAHKALETEKAGKTATTLSKGEVRITLRFSAPSWLEVDDATGRRLYHAMTPAGAARVIQGQAPLHVVLGYAPAVTLAVDGHATPIGALAQTDHAASFEVAANGQVLAGPRPAGE